jgi:hypothetical protein
VLKALRAHTGGTFLRMTDFAAASRLKHPMALEEMLYNLIFEALKAHSMVILDDLNLLDLFSGG